MLTGDVFSSNEQEPTILNKRETARTTNLKKPIKI
jgi:hypothetical protein